ncbi:MAG TPA: peptidase, partial [Eubacterium sp.]|nr:peptidase [Eubacterium sp.]
MLLASGGGVFGVLIFFAIVIVLLLVSCIKVVPQSRAFVIERIGSYLATWDAGIHWKWPFIDNVAKNV